jgi:hypothetical protein
MLLIAAAMAGLLAAQPASAMQTAAAPGSNSEMAALFAADQADRAPGGAGIDWTVVGPRDVARQARTRALLDAGALRTGEDYYRAAFIFQHGTKADDYLLAHALAVAAAARGHSQAPWIAAATLDRYLQKIGQPQIYGTQYRTPNRQSTTQDPYNRKLVPDAVRQALGVPSQAQQEARRREIEASYRNAARRP